MVSPENEGAPEKHTPNEKLTDALSGVFGHDQFRPGQREVIEDVLAGYEVVAVMPTGAGKSLCYQLPAALLGEEGVTLVVSPLIALMKDQVDAMLERGIRCTALNSSASAAEQTQILDGIAEGAYEIVFVAPERFRSGRFRAALAAAKGQLQLLAIDEAHCISEWGHEFRPAYRLLGEMVATLEPRRLIALTATATPEVRADISAQLRLKEPRAHIHGFARPNLHLSVKRVGDGKTKVAEIVSLVRSRESGTALVYAATRKNAEKYADALSKSGARTGLYHAGLTDQARAKAQDRFMGDKLDVIVATNAFGMGVDKENIRVVIHADVPRSAEAYYQEAGRAGRDGAPARCVLLFQHSDVRLQEFLIDASYPSVTTLREIWKTIRDAGQWPAGPGGEEALRDTVEGKLSGAAAKSATRILERHGLLWEEDGYFTAVRPNDVPGDYAPLDPTGLAERAQIERNKLRQMVEYAYSGNCRHSYLLDYFGDQESEREECSTCDNCLGENVSAIGDREAQHMRLALALVARLSGRFGRRRLAGLLVGSDDDDRFLELEERGSLRGETLSYVTELLRAAEGAGLVKVDRGEYPTLKITGKGRRAAEADSDLGDVSLPESTKSRKRARQVVSDTELSDEQQSIAERLRTLRKELASARSVPQYVVFDNRALVAMAQLQPSSLPELSQIPGIGPSRLDRYGEEILAAINE